MKRFSAYILALAIIVLYIPDEFANKIELISGRNSIQPYFGLCIFAVLATGIFIAVYNLRMRLTYQKAIGRTTKVIVITETLTLWALLLSSFIVAMPEVVISPLQIRIELEGYLRYIFLILTLTGTYWVERIAIQVFRFMKRRKEESEVTLSARLAAEPPQVEVVGPFLGYTGPCSIRICIGLPHLDFPQEDNKVTCLLVDRAESEVKITRTCEASCDKPPFKVFTFNFDNLDKGKRYHYVFERKGNRVDLGPGLAYDDCMFTPPDEFGDDHSFLLMSCHNPFAIRKGSANDGWALWEDVYALLKSDHNIQFLLLGGDQVYNDDVEADYFKRVRNEGMTESLEDWLRARFIRQYKLFWQNSFYRKSLARIPSIAMWDDHDITDGWGGRPESFDRYDGFLPAWKTYGKIAREAFDAFQYSRNCAPKHSVPPDNLTFTVDFGNNRLVVMDLRSEKNAKKEILVSPSTLDHIRSAISTCPKQKRLFILSPVVAFRTNFEGDKRLEDWSLLLFNVCRWFEERKLARVLLWWVWRLAFLSTGVAILTVSPSVLRLYVVLSLLMITLLGFVIERVIELPELPKLSDDLSDGLSSDCNRRTLVKILRCVFDWLRSSGRGTAILSGDIHLAGISEVVERLEGHGSLCFPQVVSSPIAYQPMPKSVEGFTTSTSEMELANDERDRMYARNIFYTSKRNFAQIFPVALDEKSSHPFVYFYMEGYEKPMAFGPRFLPKVEGLPSQSEHPPLRSEDVHRA